MSCGSYRLHKRAKYLLTLYLPRSIERHRVRAAGDRTPEQVIDDWTTVLTDDGLLIETMAEVSPGAFTGDKVRTACDRSRPSGRGHGLDAR